MKINKKIERLQELDFLNIFNFYSKDNFIFTNILEHNLENLNDYKKIKKFLNYVYHDLDESLIDCFTELQQPEYMYGHSSNFFYKHIINKIWEYKLTKIRKAFIDYLCEYKQYDYINGDENEIWVPGRYCYFIYNTINTYYSYDVYYFFDDKLDLIKNLHEEDKKEILESIESFKWNYIEQQKSILKFKVNRKLKENKITNEDIERLLK